MATIERATPRPASPAWLVIAGQELRDLWLAGRARPLMLAFSVLLSATTYLVATNQALNFLEQREAVNLTLQIGVAVAALIVLVGSADALSGERERGTLETLLLTPASRRELVVGKAIAACRSGSPPTPSRFRTCGSSAEESGSSTSPSSAASPSAPCSRSFSPGSGC